MQILFLNLLHISFRLFVLLEHIRAFFFDVLVGTKESCLLGVQIFRRSVLSGPPSPRRHAPRPDLPVDIPGCGFDS